jgi:hypothetical protein
MPVEEHHTSAVDLDQDALSERLPLLKTRYAAADPFPHIVLDDFLEHDVMVQATHEFADVQAQDWIGYVHINEKKFSNPDVVTWGPTLQRVAETLNAAPFVQFLTELTGIENLVADTDMEGGGLHRSLQGGFLNIHADFTVHPLKPTWKRRINLLLYFNEDWPLEFGGELELWSTDMKRCEVKIAPVWNRAVIFSTERDSFHGHPEPLRCPEGTARQSLALYYFTIEDRPEVRSTEYRSRPGEGLRRIPIFLDTQALRLYDRVKRRLGFSDQRLNQILRRMRHRPGHRPK